MTGPGGLKVACHILTARKTRDVTFKQLLHQNKFVILIVYDWTRDSVYRYGIEKARVYR